MRKYNRSPIEFPEIRTIKKLNPVLNQGETINIQVNPAKTTVLSGFFLYFSNNLIPIIKEIVMKIKDNPPCNISSIVNSIAICNIPDVN